jgi:hypothetical protein
MNLVLDTTNYVDNGADFYINAGQRWLDRKMTDRLSVTSAIITAPVYSVSITFPFCRNLQQVFVMDLTTGERTQLERMEAIELRDTYYGTTDLEYGTPLYYSPTFMTTNIALPLKATLTAYAGFKGTTPPTIPADEVYDGILFGPPCDIERLFEVWGRFYTPQLTSDGDYNFWTTVHPELLVMSACRMIEVFSRNTEGVKDWENSINTQLGDMDSDLAEEELADGSDVMEG